MNVFQRALVPVALSCLMLASQAQADTYVTTTTTSYDGPVIVDDSILTMGQAQSSALRREPGRVERAGLVRNNQGEPVYVFDIRQGDMMHIVRVSAITGEVVGNDNVGSPRTDGFFDRLFAPMNSGD